MTKLRGWRCFSVVMVVALILGLGAIAVPTVPAQAEEGIWDIQTVDDINVGSTSLALDSNGYPHISYTTGLLHSLHYARWTGTAWVKEMVDDVPAIVTSLALDSNGYPHIGYTTFEIGDNSLHYAHWTGTKWVKQTVDEGDVSDCSLALDSNDLPHISYTTFGIGDMSLHYAHWTGTAWLKQTVDPADVSGCSMVLDSNDRPHISYATGGLNSLHYARWTGTAWAKETVDDVNVMSTSIALDSNGYPHISYTTVELGSLHYAYWTGTAWLKQTVDPSDASDCSIALDSNNRPHISYFVGSASISDGDGVELTLTGMLKYASWTGSAWDIQTLDEETYTLKGPATPLAMAVVSKGSSIALDSYDWPHISYGNFIRVSISSLHYAHLIPPDTATVDTATGTGTATFSTSAGGIAELTAATATPCGTLPGYTFPQGFFSFAVTDILPGSTVTVTITLPSDMPINTQYWKCINGQWVDATSILGDNDGDNLLTLTLTDGDTFDADGQANGTIVDPSGPAVAAAVRGIKTTGPGVSPTIPRPLNPAQMSVQYLSVNPKQASANQPVTIITNVVNTGDEASNYHVALKINGLVEQSRMVSVGPQATQPVKFTVTKAQPGTYAVDIAGTKGSFIILGANSTGTTGSKTGALIALALIGVLIMATLVVLLLRRT
jgi:hypothetical protein